MFNLFKKPQQNNSHTFTIKGMHCVSCALNIDGALEEIPGVQTANTNYARSKTTITFDEKVTAVQTLKKTITELGYEVE